MKTINVGICGLGTIGSGTYNLLQHNNQQITAHCGYEIRVVQVGELLENTVCDLSKTDVVRDAFIVADNPQVDILVELIGGTSVARDVVMRAIANGKHVVTANKALIAEYGNEIFAAARENNVIVAFEAAVGGGIPIIKAIREGLAANRIQWLAGIINGTGNFIVTAMQEEGRNFDDVLKEAQELGYAEADPTFDIEGIDAAHKLVILASIAFGVPLQYQGVYTEGISALQLKDIRFARELGYRVKHLGIARNTPYGIELRVHPTLIPETSLLAGVDGVLNAVLVQGDAVGPTLYYGAGAGASPTASAVVADLIDVARSMGMAVEDRIPPLAFHPEYVTEATLVPMEQVETAYYLRLLALDKPGIMSKLTQLMGEQGISVEAIIQKQPKSGEDHATIVLITNKVTEASLLSVVEQIENMDAIEGPVVHIRVDSLDN